MGGTPGTGRGWRRPGWETECILPGRRWTASTGRIIFVAVAGHTPAGRCPPGSQEPGERSEMGGGFGGAQGGWGEDQPTPGMLTV